MLLQHALTSEHAHVLAHPSRQQLLGSSHAQFTLRHCAQAGPTTHLTCGCASTSSMATCACPSSQPRSPKLHMQPGGVPL